MDQDYQELEATLKKLKPAALDEDFLDRLCDAAGGRLETGTDSLRTVEAVLRKLSPAGLPGALVDGFDRRVASVPFPVDEKVVMFPKGTGEAGRDRKRKPWMAAVAAALVAGAFTALMVNPEKGTPANGVAAVPPARSEVRPGVGAMMPAGMNTGLTGARDEGVVWSSDQRPMRVVRVIYKDKVEFTNDEGNRAEIEVPRIEYIMVPARVD